MAELDRLISPDFFTDVDGVPEGGVVPLNACVVVEYMDADGKHQLATGWSDTMTFYQREGMVRSLLRDVMGVPVEFERRYAASRCDAIEAEDDD